MASTLQRAKIAGKTLAVETLVLWVLQHCLLASRFTCDSCLRLVAVEPPRESWKVQAGEPEVQDEAGFGVPGAGAEEEGTRGGGNQGPEEEEARRDPAGGEEAPGFEGQDWMIPSVMT